MCQGAAASSKEQGLPPGVPNNRVSPNIVAGLLNAGHDVLIPEMPGHGDRKRSWENAAEAHRESFTGHGAGFLAMARDESPLIVDGLLDLGLVADPARLAVVGQSWGGFHAIAKLAADPRIRCGAAIMPVCDVTVLPNFADRRRRPRHPVHPRAHRRIRRRHLPRLRGRRSLGPVAARRTRRRRPRIRRAPGRRCTDAPGTDLGSEG